MMGILSKIGGWFKGGRAVGTGAASPSSSRAEKILMALFPHYGGMAQTWTQNRIELCNHFRGWNYPPIRAICEEIAGTPPQVAYVRSPEVAAGERRKALAITDPAQRIEAWRTVNRKYLNHAQRTKALANVQAYADLELVSHTHPLVKLLRRPNGLDRCTWLFLYRYVMYLELTGNSFIWVVPNRMGRPCELWVLPAQWVRACPGQEDIVDHWEIRPAAGYVPGDMGWGWFPGGSGIVNLPREQVIHVQYPNPIHPFDGHSPIAAIAEWVDVSENIGRSRVAHFTNGAFPGVVIEIDKEVADPDPALIQRMKTEWKNKYQGVLKTKEPMVLGPGVTVKPMTTSPVDMDYVGGADQMQKWIMAAHRVGSGQVGMAEQTTFASMVASKASFHESTIKPKLTLLGQILTEELAPRFEDADHADLVIYWPDNTPVDPEQKLRQYTSTPGPAVTVNEHRRDILGLPEFEHGGDDPLLPPTLSPWPAGTGEEAEDLPLPAMAEIMHEDRQQAMEAAQEADKEDDGQLNGSVKPPPGMLNQGGLGRLGGGGGMRLRDLNGSNGTH